MNRKLGKTELEYLYIEKNLVTLCRACHIIIENDDIPQEQGGTLFGSGIKCMKLSQFLEEHPK